MPTMINSESVIRLFENNDLDYDETRQLLVYNATKPVIEFSIPWFVNEVGRTYDLAKVRAQLTAMLRDIEHTKKIREKIADPAFMDMLSKELTAFGMQYLPKEKESDPDKFAYEEDGKYLFGVDLDYIVSLLIINEKETVTSILTAMRDTERGKRNGTKTKSNK